MKILKIIGSGLLVMVLFAVVIAGILYFAPPPENYSFGGLNATKTINQN